MTKHRQPARIGKPTHRPTYTKRGPTPSGECRIDELQADLDAWLVEYNEQRTHQGRWCYGKTPMQTFIDTLPIAKEKLMQAA